ncbi:PREDICTED: hyaluronidase-1-like [Branchiostoma belcheri]|uniref:Hyaluronidase n=1 Tax=Branchiostoma belcheri TaxID=7741 RepID=A0A6P4ZKN1_BRABE|nr:PREDICTED: hyaluronidase-1-like [Branchiostoma belcheri]
MTSSKKVVHYAAIFVLYVVEVCTKSVTVPFVTPPLPSRPFLAVWNVPSEKCGSEFGVDLSLDSYNIVSNPGQEWNGTYMTIFYSQQMGLYPYYNDNNLPINGGIPQVVNMTAHLAKAAEDIRTLIADPEYRGLAVIDWEGWKLVWNRNWDTKAIYKNASRALVEKQHPDWPKEKIEAAAKEEFETAGRTMFTQTVLLAQKLRPNARWGYYLFPDCYNYKKNMYNETAEYSCPQIELERNNQIQWLFQDSTALYPSIYLSSRFEQTEDSRWFVHFRMKEAFRMRASRTGPNIPVYAYIRFVYEDTGEYLTKWDMVHTMGQAADMGADGIVIWGTYLDGGSKEACLKLQSYLQTTLGPYILNVTTAAERCSQQHCSNHGRCVLATGSHGNHDIINNVMETKENFIKYTIDSSSIGKSMRKDDLGKSDSDVNNVMSAGFYHEIPTCQCYLGWTGETCNHKV